MRATAEVVANSPASAPEISDDVASNVTPRIERDVEIPRAELPYERSKLLRDVFLRRQLVGEGSPREIERNYLIDQRAVSQQILGMRLGQKSNPRGGIICSERTQEDRCKYNVTDAPG